MIKLDYHQALHELTNAIKLRGDLFVYPDEWREELYGSGPYCRYAIDGHPACIVGQVFHQIGAKLSGLEGCHAEPRTAGLLAGIDMDEEAAVLLWYAQEAQDKGFTWGQAVSYAITEMRTPTPTVAMELT